MVEGQKPLSQVDAELISRQETFIRNFPVGTVVWRDEIKDRFGTTGPGGGNMNIYDDPRAETVWVEKIRHTADSTDYRGGYWPIDEIELKSPAGTVYE